MLQDSRVMEGLGEESIRLAVEHVDWVRIHRTSLAPMSVLYMDLLD